MTSLKVARRIQINDNLDSSNLDHSGCCTDFRITNGIQLVLNGKKQLELKNKNKNRLEHLKKWSICQMTFLSMVNNLIVQ